MSVTARLLLLALLAVIFLGAANASGTDVYIRSTTIIPVHHRNWTLPFNTTDAAGTSVPSFLPMWFKKGHDNLNRKHTIDTIYSSTHNHTMIYPTTHKNNAQDAKETSQRHLHYMATGFQTAERYLFALGKTDNSTRSDVAVYTPSSGEWSLMKNVLSDPRAQLAAASGPRYAIFAGGEDTTSPGGQAAAVDIFDVKSGKWSTLRLSQGRSFLGAASVLDADGRKS